MSRKRIPSLNMLVAIGLIQISGDELHGLAIIQKTGMKSGTVYPMLHGLVENGILKRRDETGGPREFGRPLRAFYRLTSKGSRFATAYNTAVIAEVVTKNPPLVPFEDFE